MRRLTFATSWGDLAVAGGTRAGEGTLILLPQMRLALDPGRMHRALPPMSTVCLSHGHADHIGGLCYWASQRLLNSLGPGLVLVPAAIAEEVATLLATAATLEGGKPYSIELRGVEAGDMVPLKKGMKLEFFKADHWVPTLGSRLVWTRRRLKSKLSDETPKDLSRRRERGECITDEVPTPLLSYSADTGPGIFENPDAIAAEVMLVECSFWNDNDVDRARRFGHMHVADLVEHAADLHCRHLVLLHASRRNRIAQVEGTIAAELAPHIEAEVHHLIVDWE